MQTVNLNEEQGKQLCDQIANMLLDQLDSQDIDSKIEQAVNDFIRTNNINADAADLTNRLSWSVKVALERT